MGIVTKRCAVCTEEVAPASIFCSRACQEMGRLIRELQPDGDELHTLAEEPELEDEDGTPVELIETLTTAGLEHRMRVSRILAAYAHADTELDALIWAAHSRGVSNRDIGSALEMRTSSVRRRVLTFQARLYGPAPASAAS